MNAPPNKNDLLDLLDALLGGEIAPHEHERLQKLLATDPAARRVYFNYLDLHLQLRRWQKAEAASEERLEGRGTDISLPAFRPAEEPFVPPLVLAPSTTSRYPLTAGHSFVGGWLCSYMVAAVIVGVMLLSAWAYKITHYHQIAGNRSQETLALDRPELMFVGRITGMVDCRWADPETEAYAGASVPLGRKYALASGLMEITYITGAKIILQGPCTYEVESENGGYLALGKLTARIEERREKREERAKLQEANSKSQIPNHYPLATIHYPLFSVRTPTAIVTDLGTEFGIEVSKEGNTTSHVFRGAVKVQVMGGTGTASGTQRDEMVLRENESARVEKGEDGQPSIARRAAADGSRFVLAMPPPKSVRDSEAYAKLVLSLQPVVYYRMERPKKGTGPIGAKHPEGRSGQLDLSPSSLVFDSAPGGHHGELRLGNEFGSHYVPGRFGDALWLRGPAVSDRVVVPDYPKAANDRLTVSAWVLATGRPGWATIASNWDNREKGRDEVGQLRLGLYRLDEDLYARVAQRDGQYAEVREGASQPFPLFVWQHVAFVADGTSLHLYRNGKLVASCPCAGILLQPPVANLGIGWKIDNEANSNAALGTPGWNFWQGRIDELAIFNQALSPEMIQALYLGKQLPNQTKTTTKNKTNTKGGIR